MSELNLPAAADIQARLLRSPYHQWLGLKVLSVGDGEIVLQHDTERLCMACATRRGVISQEMRRLPDEPPKLLVESDAETILVLRLDEPK